MDGQGLTRRNRQSAQVCTTDYYSSVALCVVVVVYSLSPPPPYPTLSARRTRKCLVHIVFASHAPTRTHVTHTRTKPTPLPLSPPPCPPSLSTPPHTTYTLYPDTLHTYSHGNHSPKSDTIASIHAKNISHFSHLSSSPESAGISKIFVYAHVYMSRYYSFSTLAVALFSHDRAQVRIGSVVLAAYMPL